LGLCEQKILAFFIYFFCSKARKAQNYWQVNSLQFTYSLPLSSQRTALAALPPLLPRKLGSAGGSAVLPFAALRAAFIVFVVFVAGKSALLLFSLMLLSIITYLIVILKYVNKFLMI